LDASGVGCVDEAEVDIARDDAHAEGVDNGVVAFESGYERVERVVVDDLDLGAWIHLVRA
jgi:hypothetical protein